jgi:hypothetical protein
VTTVSQSVLLAVENYRGGITMEIEAGMRYKEVEREVHGRTARVKLQKEDDKKKLFTIA